MLALLSITQRISVETEGVGDIARAEDERKVSARVKMIFFMHTSYAREFCETTQNGERGEETVPRLEEQACKS
jgi:hypothetical protein